MNTIDEFQHAIRSAPLDDTLRLVFADWLEENHGGEAGVQDGIAMLRKGQVPVDILDRMAINHLSFCRFVPGSWAKRFACDASRQVATHGYLSPKQLKALWLQCWKFRGQIHDLSVRTEASRLHGVQPVKVTLPFDEEDA